MKWIRNAVVNAAPAGITVVRNFSIRLPGNLDQCIQMRPGNVWYEGYNRVSCQSGHERKKAPASYFQKYPDTTKDAFRCIRKAV